MLEDAQMAKRPGMPIANIELVMMASSAVLAAQHFPPEVDDWEGLPEMSRTWVGWKTAFLLAHLKRQRQILALRGGNHLEECMVSCRLLFHPQWIDSNRLWKT